MKEQQVSATNIIENAEQALMRSIVNVTKIEYEGAKAKLKE